jgi:DNA-binding MarR family transcriptional regulator
MEVRNEILERVAADLTSIPPLVFRAVRKRITRMTLAEMEIEITPHHFEIVSLLSEEGTMHPSEIGQRLQIAKAQMTKLVDRLVELGIVERNIDSADRRTHNITLTEQARVMMEKHKQKIVTAVREIMASLSDDEIDNLSISLRKLKDLFLNSAADDTFR